FEKRSWQQRNRIKLPDGLSFLTVPVAVKSHFDPTIFEAKIADPHFWKTHLRSIEVNYRLNPFFDLYYCDLSGVLRDVQTSLADLNIHLVKWFCRQLGVETKLLRSSAMSVIGKRSALLVNICQSLNANYYLSPLGSSVYLCDGLDLFTNAGIEVGFQHYE